jgi:hypothetical protein
MESGFYSSLHVRLAHRVDSLVLFAFFEEHSFFKTPAFNQQNNQNNNQLKAGARFCYER